MPATGEVGRVPVVPVGSIRLLNAVPVALTKSNAAPVVGVDVMMPIAPVVVKFPLAINRAVVLEPFEIAKIMSVPVSGVEAELLFHLLPVIDTGATVTDPELR
ncbi:MAG: hypothetical protein EBV03_12045 [Proteobacteria bacterium]|nr:hypothetical protein [Pseudomonadota bacterium]